MPNDFKPRKSRKQTNYKEEPLKDREFVSNPNLGGFQLGQVLFVDIEYEEGDGSKTRPAIYLVAHDRETAIVRPLYSTPRRDRVPVIFNRNDSYAGRPQTVDRGRIVAKTYEIIEWDESKDTWLP